AFSQTEGWPFPHYYGSCGRIIVEEYVGKTLAYFENSPWKQRIDIAYQLLQISQMLTENSLEFALYMTDVNMDNFAVRSDGTVLLVDIENIVIVDRLMVQKGKNYSGQLHQSGEFCKDCLSFSYEDLCNHDLSDHNYYAICKGLLVPNSYYSAKGLLHNIPETINMQTNLSALVHECANPSVAFNRFHVVPKILQVMKSLL
ncbi:divergent protein kinase domain 2A-like, partial [Stegodyphus dumicola]|uniref:divergent protein kinase domain 2A-like n=1 Tax=Stegodyphus dumicola TaxID=202533 RepID=UPI0015B05E8F